MKLLRTQFISLFLLFFFCAFSLNGQVAEFVKGEILVQTINSSVVAKVVDDLRFVQGQATELKVERAVSAPLDIWLFSFDNEQISHRTILNALKSHHSVREAQNNHLIEYRATEPNDPQFDEQWQYINDGSTGGTPGADIDMDLAWDITTGGTTTQGDEIVVCVVDDGIDFDHEDWGDNLWENTAEIPGNGIDEDNNGYIDDYLGWNADDDNDDIEGSFFNDHGTPVAGIMAAQGNNDIGVSGVNWDVKLMMVVGGGNEAQAIEAYTYPYTMRLLYNNTNGEEGAFVVAINSSWGINFGDPDESPLWCSFYDTMGEEGIINCGATMNLEENVDAVGDLPTACSSDYLISVTNMNFNDVKVNGAAYGAETIDLGAFGDGTWTLEYGGGYGGFGGTSGATPHVTGTVGLCYAAPCNSLIALAKADPGAAALLVKQYILDGVDPNASLDGITVTGGRLNANNTLALLVGNCDDSGCSAATNIGASVLTDVVADLSWETFGESTPSYQYSVLLDNDTIQMGETEETGLNLVGLEACTDYIVQIQSICDTTESGVNLYNFKTDGCCELPAQANVIQNGDVNQLILSDVFAATEYTIEYKPAGSADWIVTTLTGSEYTFPSDLEECTTYEVRLQTVCGEESTAYSEIQEFVAACGQCTAFEYCEIGGNNSNFEWLESIAIDGGAENVTGNNEGYLFTTGVFATFSLDCDHVFELTPGFGNQNFGEIFSIWLDLNQDGLFDDDEMLAISDAEEGTTTETITIPADAMTGVTRMRIKMEWENQAVMGACGIYNFGETEDYCVRIEAGGDGEEISVAVSDIEVDPVCPGEGVQLSAVASEGVIYEWSPATGLSATDIADPIASPMETTTYTLTVSKAGGCAEILATDEVTVFVNDEIDLNLQAVEIPTVCSGTTVVLDVGTLMNATYQWEPSAGLDNPNSPNPTASVTETTTYTATIVAFVGACEVTETADVVVEVLDEIDGTVSPDQSICIGSEIELSVEADGAVGSWMEDATLTDWDTANPTANPTETTTYTGTLTKSDGDCVIEETYEVTIEVLPVPSVESASALPENGCEDNVWSLEGTTVSGDVASYQWTTADGSILGDANQANILIEDVGTYMVTGISADGCGSVESMVVVETLPGITSVDEYEINGDNLIAPTGFASYQWYKDGAEIAGANTQEYEVDASGNYSVLVSNDLGCTSESAAQNVTFSGIEQLALNAVQVFPNPTNGLLQINYKDLGKIEQINVYDATGKVVYSRQNAMPQTLNLSGESNGVYFVEIVTEQGVWSERVIKY